MTFIVLPRHVCFLLTTPLAKGGYVFGSICLSVLVSKIIQQIRKKLQIKFYRDKKNQHCNPFITFWVMLINRHKKIDAAKRVATGRRAMIWGWGGGVRGGMFQGNRTRNNPGKTICDLPDVMRDAWPLAAAQQTFLRDSRQPASFCLIQRYSQMPIMLLHLWQFGSMTSQIYQNM